MHAMNKNGFLLTLIYVDLNFTWSQKDTILFFVYCIAILPLQGANSLFWFVNKVYVKFIHFIVYKHKWSPLVNCIDQVWARIWCVLASHFIFAGNNPDERVNVYCIDSLKQLVMKYLEHTELTNFRFQNDILQPFVTIMCDSKSESMRKRIVDSIVQVCLLCFSDSSTLFFHLKLDLFGCFIR